MCIVFVASLSVAEQRSNVVPGPTFRSFLLAYFPIVPNLTMLFIFGKVYRLFSAGQHPQKLKNITHLPNDSLLSKMLV